MSLPGCIAAASAMYCAAVPKSARAATSRAARAGASVRVWGARVEGWRTRRGRVAMKEPIHACVHRHGWQRQTAS
jgi:hypothetical protein